MTLVQKRPVPADQEGLRRPGLADAPHRVGRGPAGRRGRRAGPWRAPGFQRDADDRDAAAVGRPGARRRGRSRSSARARRGCAAAPDGRSGCSPWSARRDGARWPGSRVLARAVVVQRRGLLVAPHQRMGRPLVEGHVGAAFEIGFRQPDPRQPCGDPIDMAGLAVCEAQASAISSSPEAEGVGGAALDQRHRLQRLDRRAGIDRPLDVAPGRAPRRAVDDRRCRDGGSPPSSPRVTSTRIGAPAAARSAAPAASVVVA